MPHYEAGTVQGTISFHDNTSAQFKLVWIIPEYLKLKQRICCADYIQFKKPVSIIPGIFSLQAALYPNGYSADLADGSTFLLRNVGSMEIWMSFQFSILSGNFEKIHEHLYNRGTCRLFQVSNRGKGIAGWFSHNYVEENADIVLPNGSLQIVIQGTVYTSDPVTERVNVLKDSSYSVSTLTFKEPVDQSDAILSVGNENFHVNKVILSRRSSVFQELFQNQTQNILVLQEDVSAAAFRQILQYMYTDILTSEFDTMLPEIIALANKYNLHHLCTMCEEKMANKLSVSNAVEYLQLADKIHGLKLKEKVITFIAQNRKTIVEEESWRIFKSRGSDLLIEVLDKLMTA